MKNLTKKLLLTTCLTATLVSASFAAEEEAVSPISANVTIANDYVWRGLTQTDGELAIQGGFDYDAGNGFAAGVWGSNVDFNSDASSEFDLYASYSGEVDDFGYEVGYIAYRYPSESAIDFEEAYVGGSYAGVNLTYYAGLGEFDDGATVENYVEVSYDLPIEEVGVSVLYGDYKNGYDYYGIGIGQSFSGLDFGLNYTKTSPDDGGDGENNTVFSISKSF
ncbi:conserved hypothetical protein [uncultured Candidatus Thioglobus sp.]|nr:conserved hypothetical protein [uncultured Candidatus Thioglobus sp.]